MTRKRNPRPRGDGGISTYQLADGTTRYVINWYEPRDPEDPDSPKQRKVKRGFLDEDEARKALRAKLVEIDSGTVSRVPSQGGPTMEKFLKEWVAAHRVAASTRAGYMKNLRLHVIPYIGHMPVRKVTPRTLSGLYLRLEETGSKSNKPGAPAGLGPNTIRKIHQMLSVAFEAAMDDHLIDHNPAKMRGTRPPTTKDVATAKPDVEVWQIHHLNDFLEWARTHDPDYFAIWWLISHTGMRRGEAIALRWKDVMLPKGLYVRRSRTTVKVKGQPEYDDLKMPKNSKARLVALDKDTAQVLKAHRQLQAARGFERIRPERAVFTIAAGREIRPNHLTRRWERAMTLYRSTTRGAHVPDLTIHGLRHTHASHLLAAGVHPKVVQQRLGHSSISITMDLYSHLMDSVQQSAMDDYAATMEAGASPGRDEVDFDIFGPRGGVAEEGS